MTLHDWLSKHDIADAEFAKTLGVVRFTVWRYRKGIAMPDRDTLNAIFEATSGAVTANDFVHAAPAQEGVA